MTDSEYFIGVSGHIGIDDAARPALEKSVREILGSQKEAAGGRRCIAVSALAEGADRLFARVAGREGIPLAVVLTADEETFEKDFTSTESVQEFRRMLAAAEFVFRPYETDKTAPSSYAIGDAFLCRTCDVMVVLWDGEPTEHPAGTARVVDLRCGRGVPPHLPGEDHTGPVIHVWTPRPATPLPDGISAGDWMVYDAGDAG